MKIKSVRNSFRSTNKYKRQIKTKSHRTSARRKQQRTSCSGVPFGTFTNCAAAFKMYNLICHAHSPAQQLAERNEHGVPVPMRWASIAKLFAHFSRNYYLHSMKMSAQVSKCIMRCQALCAAWLSSHLRSAFDQIERCLRWSHRTFCVHCSFSIWILIASTYDFDKLTACDGIARYNRSIVHIQLKWISYDIFKNIHSTVVTNEFKQNISKHVTQIEKTKIKSRTSYLVSIVQFVER